MAKYNENIFTKIVIGEAKAEMLLENEFGMVFKDKYPKHNIHFIIIPRTFTVNILDFYTNSTIEEIRGFTKLILMALRRLNIENKFEILTNGGYYQEIGHFHMHIIDEISHNHNVEENRKEVLLENNYATVFKTHSNQHNLDFIVMPKNNIKNIFDFYENSSNLEILEVSNLVVETIRLLKIELGFQIIIKSKANFGFHIISDLLN